MKPIIKQIYFITNCLSISKYLLISGGLLVSFTLNCAGDPRKNCNHPKHVEWVKEKTLKKYGKK